MNHHAGLTNGETKEDANCVCRDQQRHKGTSCDKEDHSTSCNRNDATAVCESITPLANLSREEAVTSEDPCKLRPTIESSVGRKKQNASRCNLENCVRDSTTERRASDLREERLATYFLWELPKRKGEK